MARDDQDGGQFGRDARKHLRTTDQASMKRTAMDAKVGQMPGMVGDAGLPRKGTGLAAEAHKVAQVGKSYKHASGETVKVSRITHGQTPIRTEGGKSAGRWEPRSFAHAHNPQDADDSEGGHGEHEEPSHYESAMSRKTGASVGQLRKEQAAAESKLVIGNPPGRTERGGGMPNKHRK